MSPFLANSNSISHLARVDLAPREASAPDCCSSNSSLDHPGSFGPGVTDRDVATELDAYVDWKLNQNFTISVLGAFANPQSAVEEATGRTKGFGYGMVYVGYSY